MFLRGAILFGLLVAGGLCYSTGAPESACLTLVPGHRGQFPQTDTSPFQLVVSSYGIDSGSSVDVSIIGATENAFRGFLLKAVRTDNHEVIGKFLIDSDDLYSQPLNCGAGKGSGATHKKVYDEPLQTVSLQWVAPDDFKGTVVFNSTVVVSYTKFWVGIVSDPVTIV